MKTKGDPRWFPEELRRFHKTQRASTKNTDGGFIVLFSRLEPKGAKKILKNPDKLLVFRAYNELIQAIVNLSYRSMLLAPLKIDTELYS